MCHPKATFFVLFFYMNSIHLLQINNQDYLSSTLFLYNLIVLMFKFRTQNFQFQPFINHIHPFMPNYKDIRNHCRVTQRLSATVIDEYLISYAAHQDKLYRKAEKKLARYKHVIRELPERWTEVAITQYIAHQIFKQGGLINRYIHHAGLNHLLEEEMAFLEFYTRHPWRFSFAEISGRPDKDFYEMHDVFTGDSYLLYSPGLTTIVSSQKTSLCFNLIGYNGKCWQTFGPIGTYQGFEPQDILFFANKLNHGDYIENEFDLMKLVEADPLPFMHLIYGSNYPQTFHIDNKIVQITAEYLDDSFDANTFRNHFTVEYSQGVYKLSQPEWDEFPHFSAVYYEEKEELLFLYSMTDRGFHHLVEQLNNLGYELSPEPDIRVNMGMVLTAGEILKKEFNLNPYYNLFTTEEPEEDSEELMNIKEMLSAMTPYVNAGKKVNLNEISNMYNVPLETVKELHEQLLSKLDQLK